MVEFEEKYNYNGKASQDLTKKQNKKFSTAFPVPIIELIFDLCIDCILHIGEMASIPQGMFMATKMRESRDKMTVARNISGEGFQQQKYFNTKLMELTPLKYNSKLMNSIWGLYNRYSPHNIKRTNDEYADAGDLQPYMIVANLQNCAAQKEAADQGAKPPAKGQSGVPMLEKFWSTMPISH